MLKYLFGFEQVELVKQNITTAQVILLKYFDINNGKELTYNQIIKDLPILNIQERQLMRYCKDLKQKGFIKITKTQYGIIINIIK